jgi:nucleotide-binding universal stress UspA family protein
MIAIKTILLPTDGSEYSLKAMAYALTIANQFRARVVALNVIDQRWEDRTRQTFGEIQQAVLKKAIERSEDEARGVVGAVADAGTEVGVAVDPRIAEGTPVEQIVRLAKEVSADLIIMGTHGRTGISRVFLGSVAERVVRRAPCPVLTVRSKEHDFIVP